MKLKRMVTAILIMTMVLSLLTLSGCKKRDDEGDVPSTGPIGDVSGNEDDAAHSVGDVIIGDDVVDFNDIDVDVRVLPQGILRLPVSENVVRGVVAEGSFDFTSEETDSSLLIPIGTVPLGTVITIPVTYDGVPFSVMVYDQGEDEYEYFAAFDVSPVHGLSGEIGFSQIEYNGYTSYLVCNVCGQVIRQDVMDISNDTLGHQFCRPWTLSHEQCYTFEITSEDLDILSIYSWISDTETGEYSSGVPYISTQSVVGKKGILILHETLKEAYEEFMRWEVYKQFSQGVNLPDGMIGSGITTDDSDPNSIPTVDNNGLDKIPTVD